MSYMYCTILVPLTHHILRRGRRATGAGRFFRDENGAGAYTIADELEGWAAYQENKARATLSEMGTESM